MQNNKDPVPRSRRADGGWILYYQADSGLVQVSGIRLHRLLEDFFLNVLDDIWNYSRDQIGTGGTGDQIRAWLHLRRLDQHGGGFNFRKITAGQNFPFTHMGLPSTGIQITIPARSLLQRHCLIGGTRFGKIMAGAMAGISQPQIPCMSNLPPGPNDNLATAFEFFRSGSNWLWF